MTEKEKEIRTNLDYPLVKFSKTNEQDWWTTRDAVRGIQIFGGIGSGKSSGSGKTFAKTFLKNGFGGLVLCVKPDERANWEKLAKETGRENDLIIFKEDSEYQFNPLQYELTREGKGAGEVFNLSYLFMEIYKMGNRFSGSGGGGESERYWDNALKRCINRMIQLLKFAKEQVSIDNMISILSQAPYEEDVKQNWENIKLKEGKKSVLEGVPNSLPALVKANRIQEKVAGVGFDWEEPSQVFEKVQEELSELQHEVKHQNADRLEAEFGDVLFSMINYARFLDINPENALERTNKKFIKRFQYLEEKARASGKTLKDMTLAEMDVFWEEAKSL